MKKATYLFRVMIITIFCFLLSLPVFAIERSNPGYTGSLKTSSKCIEMIKGLEGYIESPRWDVSQYSIGYGCNTTYAKKYGFSTERLSKADAHQLVCYVIAELEEDMNAFLSKYGIELNQYQYDALMSLTYNVGKVWMDPNTRIAKLLIDGEYTVNEFASAFGIYCHMVENNVTTIEPRLVSRRIQEIKLFLYGAYKLSDVPQQFCRVLFYSDEGGYVPIDIGFYQVGEPYQELFEAEPDDGTYFIGWYDANGNKVTAYDIAEGSTTLFAKYSPYYEDPESWTSGEFFVPDGPEITETYYDGSIQTTSIYSIERVTIEDKNGNMLNKIPNHGFFFDATISKQAGNEEALVLLVLYSTDGKFLEASFLRPQIKEKTTFNIGIWVENKNQEIGELKALIISSFSNPSPLCASLSLS